MRKFTGYSRLLCALSLALVVPQGACSGGAGVESRVVSAGRREGVRAERVAMPMGARAVGAWASPEGGGALVLEDGRVLVLDRAGRASEAPRASGPTVPAEERGTRAVLDRGDGEALVLATNRVLALRRGVVVAVELPAFLQAPTGFARWGTEALWSAPTGVFASDGPRWLRLDTAMGALTDAVELSSFEFTTGEPEAWVRTSAGVLRRVRWTPSGASDPGAAEGAVRWFTGAPGLELGAVRAIAAMSTTRGVIAAERGAAVVGSTFARSFTLPGTERGPDAVAGGGGYAWVLWSNTLFRTDGDRWEALATDPSFTAGSRIAVDESSGTSALVVDASGGAVRVRAERVLWLSGVREGETLVDPLVPLEALEDESGPALREVRFTLDDEATPVLRTQAPWGWGSDGRNGRELGARSFGAHTVRVRASFVEGPELERVVRFAYAPPLGRVPAYARDVNPLFQMRCGRCHAAGSVARDLSTYELLRSQAPIVRSSVREGRMPPDVRLDPASAAVFTAWADGETPP